MKRIVTGLRKRKALFRKESHMVEVIKKHFMSKKVCKNEKKKVNSVERFGENLANSYIMGMISGNYSVENL